MLKIKINTLPVVRNVLTGDFVSPSDSRGAKLFGKLSLLFSRQFSQWDLVSAVCLERKPVITQNLTPLEKKYYDLMQEIELQKSHHSDHELRKMEDLRQAKLAKEGQGEDIDASKRTAQDFEDMCLKELKAFDPASRITEADVKNDQKSVERKLDCNLVFVVKQKLGSDFRWILPQAVHTEGETLRQTAERGLSDVLGSQEMVQFLGNAPVGYYKYKYPTAMRESGICGAKVFFFKALLQQPVFSAELFKKSPVLSDYLWLTRPELKQFLQPSYHRCIDAFLLPDDSQRDISNEKTESSLNMELAAV